MLKPGDVQQEIDVSAVAERTRGHTCWLVGMVNWNPFGVVFHELEHFLRHSGEPLSFAHLPVISDGSSKVCGCLIPEGPTFQAQSPQSEEGPLHFLFAGVQALPGPDFDRTLVPPNLRFLAFESLHYGNYPLRILKRYFMSQAFVSNAVPPGTVVR